CFIQDQETRIGNERTADGEHLLFAAGKQIGHAAGALGKPREQRQYLFECPWFASATIIRRGRNQVLTSGKIWEHLTTFGNKANTTLGDPIGGETADLVAIEADGPS